MVNMDYLEQSVILDSPFVRLYLRRKVYFERNTHSPMNYLTARAFAREMRKHPTKAEKFFWQKVRDRQIAEAKFHRQYIFEYRTLEQRKSYFIVDFYCPAHRLIVEIDGPIHDLQQEYDRFRESILTTSWPKSILRFTNEEILDNWSVVKSKLLATLVTS